MTAAAVMDESLDEALSVFSAQTGLVFPGNRRGDFVAGAKRAMAQRHMPDGRGLAEGLRLDRRLLEDLVAEVTVHESYFFREPAQFGALRELVLPQLKRERAPESLLQVWSAGCARGEEAYSLAILLEQEGLLRRSRVRGTDISRAALADAAKARYTAWSFRGGQIGQDPRYFERRGATFRPQARIRDSVTFQALNLAAGPYARPAPGTAGYDLILCRNVLIYFDAKTVRDVARWLYEALAVGGWLITAPADPPLWDHAPFEVRTAPGGVLYRKGPVGRAVRPAREPRKAATRAQSPAPAASAPARAASRARAAPSRQARRDHPPVPVGVSAAAPDLAACLAHIKTLANTAGSGAAERAAAEAAARHSMSPELHYLRAILLLDLRRWDEAVKAIQQVLYLDRSLVAGHVLLGSALRLRGDLAGARRAYRSALKRCEDTGSEKAAALTDGESVQALAALAAAELETLPDREPTE